MNIEIKEDRVIVDGKVYVDCKDKAQPADPTEGHSPLPWKVSTDGTWTIDDSEGYGTGITFVCGKECQANVALIVRAVNHHAELMVFMGKVAAYHNDPCLNSRQISDEARDLIARIRGTP